MSGGAFDYQQHRLNEMAEELELLIVSNGTKDEWGYARSYKPETLAIFKETADELRWLYKVIHEIDWAVSDDTCEETLLKEWKKLKKIK